MELEPMLGAVHIYVGIFSISACIIKLKNAIKLLIRCIAYVMLLQQAFYSWRNVIILSFLYIRRMVLLLSMHFYTINHKICPREEEALMGERSMFSFCQARKLLNFANTIVFCQMNTYHVAILGGHWMTLMALCSQQLRSIR